MKVKFTVYVVKCGRVMKIFIDIRVAVGCTNLFLADRYRASAIFLDAIQ